MQQDDLSSLLRQLPRTGASSGFQEQIHARLRGRRTRRLQVRLAAAVTLFVMLSAGGGYAVHQKRLRFETARREQMVLARELAELKVQSAKYEPVLVVGTTAGEAYLLDLRKPAGQAVQRTSSTYW